MRYREFNIYLLLSTFKSLISEFLFNFCYLHTTVLLVGVDEWNPYSGHEHFVDVCGKVTRVYIKEIQIRNHLERN